MGKRCFTKTDKAYRTSFTTEMTSTVEHRDNSVAGNLDMTANEKAGRLCSAAQLQHDATSQQHNTGDIQSLTLANANLTPLIATSSQKTVKATRLSVLHNHQNNK